MESSTEFWLRILKDIQLDNESPLLYINSITTPTYQVLLSLSLETDMQVMPAVWAFSRVCVTLRDGEPEWFKAS